jgi:opacity protein-like surface antigen
MKKLLIISSIVASLATASTSALAKTQGHYLGLDLLRTQAEAKSNSTAVADQTVSMQQYYNHKDSDTSYGFGINYKYAFNFDNFFVAPGVSVDLLGNKIKSGFSTSANDPYSQEIKLNSRLTAQANLGYDLTDQFAAYVPLGISSFSYEMKTADVSGNNYIQTKKTGNETSFFFGLGFSYQPVKNIAVNLEYNRIPNLQITSGAATFNNGKIRSDIDVNMVKLGLAYNF